MGPASRKILSLTLSALLVVGTLPQTVFAVGGMSSSGAGGNITAFELLEDSVKNRIEPLGTSLEDLKLPASLMTTVENDSAQDTEESEEKNPAESTQDGNTPGEDSDSGSDVPDPDGDEEAPADNEQQTGTPSEAQRSDNNNDNLLRAQAVTGYAAVLDKSGRVSSSILNLAEDSDDTDHTGSTQQTVSVPVTEWTSEPEFDPDTLGTYVFTPVLDEAWSLADGVEIPTITVQMVMGIMQLASDLSSFTFDISEGNITIEEGATSDTLKVSYGEKQVKDNIPENEKITLTGNSEGRQIEIKASCSVKLENLDITSSATPIRIEGDSPIKVVDITLSGTNTLISTNDHGFGLTGGHTVTVCGSGSLSVTGGVTGDYYGIDIGNRTQLVITEEADVTAEGRVFGIGTGTLSQDYCSLTISGNAQVRAEGDDYGIGGVTSFKVILKDSAQVWATSNANFENSSGKPLYLLETTVTDSTDNLVEGAQVQSGSRSTTTDANGKAYLYIPADEEVTLKISKTGYVTVQELPFSKDSSGENKSLVLSPLSPETPVISGQPQSSSYNQGDAAAAISVTASVSEGTTLSYQWYSNTTDSTTGSSQIIGAAADSYIPDTSMAGTRYYYCIVTGTNIGVGGPQPAAVTSSIAAITVNSSGGNSGGDSSDSSNSDDDKTIKTIPSNQTDMPTVVRKEVSGTTEINVLTADTITEQMGKDIIAAAEQAAKAANKAANGIAVEFDIKTGGDYESLVATIEAGTIDLLNAAGVKYVRISSALADISFNTKAFKELDTQSAGTVTLSVKKAEKLSDSAKAVIGENPAFDITIEDSRKAAITDLRDGTATIGIAYDAKTEGTGSLYAVSVKQNGQIEWITNSSYTGSRLLFCTNHFSVYGVGFKTAASAFSDTKDHWAQESINFVASRGLLTGTSATGFSPNSSITKGMFITALGRLSGQDMGGYTQSSFTDVKSDSHYLSYIQWGVNLGIVSGGGDNKFEPDRAITREEMAVMLYNYTKATGYTLPKSVEKLTFTDNGSISTGAKEAVSALQQAGIAAGTGNKLFNPQSTATRGEAAVILRNLVESLIEESTARGWSRDAAGNWMYVQDNGDILTGNWLTDIDTRYYFDTDGVMAAGRWLQIGGKWYYFNADGTLAKSTKVDGYELDENGVRKT